MPPIFTRDIRPTLLWIYHNLSSSVYGAVTLYCAAFQKTSTLDVKTANDKSEHHIHYAFLHNVQFALCRFRSPLITASHLLSFPAPTKMLQFGAFPYSAEAEYNQGSP